MNKEVKICLMLSLLFLILLIGFVFYFPFKITGSAIYESQPGPEEGKDTYIREPMDTNYATQPVLKIGQVASGELRSLIEFNLSSIPSENTIIDARLDLYLSHSSNDNNITLKAYRLTSPWNLTETGWYNRTSSDLWTTEGGDYAEEVDSIILTNETGWYNLTITSVVRGWVNGSYENYGLLLIAEDAEAGDFKDIDSSNSVTENQRPKITINHIPNAPPTIHETSTDSSLENPKQIGESVTFTINWTDLEGDEARAFVCNSSNITLDGCEPEAKTFCSTELSLTNPITCSYQITEQENRTTNFWVAVCDSSGCSEINQSQFYMNHAPKILLIDPNGGETVNQSQGNYLIRFNVSDNDSDLLTASIYYGETQNSTDNTIAENINLSNFCTGENFAVTNNCSYSWDSTGIYGTFFMTIIVNDSYITSIDSSDNSFDVRSIIDNEAPQIHAQWIDDLDIYSGKEVIFYANITDENQITNVWVSINTTPVTSITMTNITSITYSGNWEAIEKGAYQFKVFAEDILGNLNDTMAWEIFSIRAPEATSQNETAPPIALPYHTIKIFGELKANNSLKNVYAYLNVPAGFVFLSDYPQNSFIGNFTADETKNTTWFLSTPIDEGSYTLNITYTDSYQNKWNSSNMQVQVTSAIGGYVLSASGYSTVVAGNNYYIEAEFQQIGHVDPDTIQISIFDAAGNLVVESVSMTQMSTGRFNHTYTTSPTAVQGDWNTRINATKNSESYYTGHFWRVVGGIFDVRDIVIIDAEVPNLEINVTTENVGDIPQDLILEWNLTREDNGVQLDAGADTFAVQPNSERIWTVNPTTDYVGQVRITFIGYYGPGFSEKAGAFGIFSTTSDVPPKPTPTPSPTPTPIPPIIEKTANFSIEFEEEIYLARNIEKTTTLKITNTGEKTLNNIVLTIEGLDDFYYTIIPQKIDLLETQETKEFKIRLYITDLISEKEFFFNIKTDEIEKKANSKIIIVDIKEFFQREIQRLRNKIIELQEVLPNELIKELKICEEGLEKIKEKTEIEDFLGARELLQESEECIAKIKTKYERIKVPMQIIQISNIFWVIAIIALLILILVLIYLFKIYKKFNIINFLKKEQTRKSSKETEKKDYMNFDRKIKDIEDRLVGSRE